MGSLTLAQHVSSNSITEWTRVKFVTALERYRTVRRTSSKISYPHREVSKSSLWRGTAPTTSWWPAKTSRARPTWVRCSSSLQVCPKQCRKCPSRLLSDKGGLSRLRLLKSWKKMKFKIWVSRLTSYQREGCLDLELRWRLDCKKCFV